MAQCVRAYVFESKVFVTMVLILIFGEVLGLYGYVCNASCNYCFSSLESMSSLIVALIMNSRATEASGCI